MQSLDLLILVIISSSGDAKLGKSGIFDNVTLLVTRLGEPSHVVVVDFDDSLTKYVVPSSEGIVIKDQLIPKLDTNCISDFPKLKNLSLVSNGIREIRRGAFKNLPNLKLLNLSHNDIEEVRQGIFNHLPMEDLYLNNNKISRIGYKAFSHLHLRNLFLNNNKISRWSKDWFADSSVLILDLSYNLVEELPPNSFHLMSEPVNGSMSLIFSGNQLKKINNHVFNGFDKLRSIFLDSNLIERLAPGAFNGVKYVNSVNLNNNSLTEIRAEVLRGTQVDVLMLEDNKLRCLSTDLFRMEELDIDGNPITCFCVKTWLDWRERHSNPSIYHITNLEEECI